ncbi:MAG: hypothetical protein CVT92_11495 [Bacteroidetes bacterium HGW-Bacteroidetes-1]|jgi:hypothetical protein|nr:MAG: hypothetical protein CVT92_11495 [Bacteroidetes bacterium HGW-Bacteroidetes-1]
MKSRIIFLLVIATILISANGCSKEKQQQKLSGKLTHHSECKSTKSGTYPAQISDSLSCAQYSYDSNSKKLIITHINAGFNCCPEVLSCIISENNNTITIQEIEKDHLCNCNCLFDLGIEINDIESESYQIVFIEPYCGDQEPLIFEINLAIADTGSYCVVRNQYPWGI